MHVSDILAADGVLVRLAASTKRDALRALADRAAVITGLDAREVLETLQHRERLGSTGLGRGIAIPHGKIRGLSGIVTLFARLDNPIDFDSLDGEPVDLVFVLLAPEHAGGDHLKALASISRLVRDPATLDALRAARDVDGVLLALRVPETSNAA